MNPSTPTRNQTHHDTIGSIMMTLRRPSKRTALGQRADAQSKKNRNRFVITRSRRGYTGGTRGSIYPFRTSAYNHPHALESVTASSSTSNGGIPLVVQIFDDEIEDHDASDCSMSVCLEDGSRSKGGLYTEQQEQQQHHYRHYQSNIHSFTAPSPYRINHYSPNSVRDIQNKLGERYHYRRYDSWLHCETA